MDQLLKEGQREGGGGGGKGGDVRAGVAGGGGVDLSEELGVLRQLGKGRWAKWKGKKRGVGEERESGARGAEPRKAEICYHASRT